VSPVWGIDGTGRSGLSALRCEPPGRRRHGLPGVRRAPALSSRARAVLPRGDAAREAQGAPRTGGRRRRAVGGPTGRGTEGDGRSRGGGGRREAGRDASLRRFGGGARARAARCTRRRAHGPSRGGGDPRRPRRRPSPPPLIAGAARPRCAGLRDGRGASLHLAATVLARSRGHGARVDCRAPMRIDAGRGLLRRHRPARDQRPRPVRRPLEPRGDPPRRPQAPRDRADRRWLARRRAAPRPGRRGPADSARRRHEARAGGRGALHRKSARHGLHSLAGDREPSTPERLRDRVRAVRRQRQPRQQRWSAAGRARPRRGDRLDDGGGLPRARARAARQLPPGSAGRLVTGQRPAARLRRLEGRARGRPGPRCRGGGGGTRGLPPSRSRRRGGRSGRPPLRVHRDAGAARRGAVLPLPDPARRPAPLPAVGGRRHVGPLLRSPLPGRPAA